MAADAHAAFPAKPRIGERASANAADATSDVCDPEGRGDVGARIDVEANFHGQVPEVR